MRIILDAVIGRGETTELLEASQRPPANQNPMPWTAKMKAPAIKSMSKVDLVKCIDLAEAIAKGSVDLSQLNAKSLELRGKTEQINNVKKKRKFENEDTEDQHNSGKLNTKQRDIRNAFGFLAASALAPAEIDAELLHSIETSDITPFR